MKSSHRWTSAFAFVAVLTISLAAGAWARGPSRGGLAGRVPAPRFVPPRPGAVHSHGLLAQLIYPCPTDCLNTARVCYDAADTAALACVSSACPTEIQAAQTACADDRRSESCQDAVGALQDCADTCLDTRAAEVDECRDDLSDCRDACETE
jgi:hypothetical protein